MQQTFTFLKKILLIRFSSIGDIVLTTPIVRALKKQLNCELHVLTKSQFAGIYNNNPYVDKVHSWSDNLNGISQKLKTEHFDFVVDLQKNFKSHKLIKVLKKPSASFSKLNLQKWMLVNFKMNFLPDTHIVDRYFEAVSHLKVKNDQQGLDYFIPGEDEIKPENIDPILKKGYVGFAIGARHNTKILPPEKVELICEKMNLPVVLLGGPEDKEEGEEIARNVELNKVFNSCGQYNLNQSASLVKQASLIITNDTGLMHIAAALQKPIISIWGNTIPKFGMYPYMPDNKKQSLISEVADLKCRPCSKLGFQKCPKKHFKCMLDQDVDVILEKVKYLTQL